MPVDNTPLLAFFAIAGFLISLARPGLDRMRFTMRFSAVLLIYLFVVCVLEYGTDVHSSSRSTAEFALVGFAKSLEFAGPLFAIYFWKVAGRPSMKQGWDKHIHCQKCGYDLTGNTSGVCSECGTPISSPREASTARE